MSKIDEVVAEAEREHEKEALDRAKAELKIKLHDIARAEKVVRNLKHELTVLKTEIADDVAE